MKLTKKKVVLFFPSYSSNEASPPLSLISIAVPLLNHGYELKIIDQTIEPDYLNIVLKETKDALCLGISLITGPMILGAVEVGKAVKSTYPELPIVLGGWHPSILPEQTLQASFVDVVVLRQGEITLLELAQRFEAGSPINDVPGVLWKDGNQIQKNPERKYPKVRELPSRLPGYDLVDFNRYENKTGLRWAMYSTSHGCPYNCSYCSNASVYGRKLDFLPVEQVVEEVCELVRRHNLKLLGIIDDIFFAFMDRCLEIAEGFIRSGLGFEWYIQDRVDSWARLSQDQAKLYKRAGLVRVHFGAESGSDRVLKSIEKRSKVETTVAAVERCNAADIRASLGFIFGLPEEREEDLLDTLRLINSVHSHFDKVDCYTNIFTPYPGSPLWPVAVRKGFSPPRSLEEWADFYPRVTRLSWLSDKEYRRLQVIRQFLRFAHHQVKVGENPHPLRHRLVLRMMSPTSRLRIRNGWFRWPFEIYSYWGLQRLKKGWVIDERF